MVATAVLVAGLSHRAVAQFGGGPTVTIVPHDSTYAQTAADTIVVNVTVTFCSKTSAQLDASSRIFTLDGNPVNLSQTSASGSGCVFMLAYAGPVTLPKTNDGVHAFDAEIDDVNGYHGGSIVHWTYHWPGWVAPSYGVRVLPPAHTLTMAAGARTATFKLMNVGSRPATYGLTSYCTGKAVAGCSVPGTVTLDTSSTGRTQSVTVSFTAQRIGSDTADTGAVALRAVNQGSGLSADVGQDSLGIVLPAQTPNNAPGVILAGSGDVLARDQCLTIGAGPAAAYECGDLRLVHATASAVTRGKARGAVLLYNSAHTIANVVIQADVTPVTTQGALDSVVATVLTHQEQFGRASWPGSQWTLGATRRVGVLLSRWKPTGIYDDTMTVRYYWTNGSTTQDVVPGQFAVVNRTNTPLGRGWWLSGVEQLVKAQQAYSTGADSLNWLWVGGDGSTKLYRYLNSSHWVASTGVRPDTLTTAAGGYVRTLPSGAKVLYDGSGRHIATVPLLGDSTTIGYDGQGRVSRIVMPSGATRVLDTLTYATDASGTGTVTVTLMSGTAARSTVLTLALGKVMSIRDPDSTSVQFTYLSDSCRIISRTDRTGQTTSYAYDAAGHLVRETPPISGVVNFAPAESKGVAGTSYAAAQYIDSVYTNYDGPRTDVADVIRIWPNRYGAPAKIRNPYGRETKITYGDARWPALSTQVIGPSGAITRAWYDAAGRTDSTKAFNVRFIGDVSPATRYWWDARFLKPDSVKAPTGVMTFYGWNADGTPASVQLGRNVARRTTVSYYTGAPRLAGFYSASTVPGVAQRDSVVYDTLLLNSSAARDRNGHWHYSRRDALGRPVVDSTEYATGKWRRDSTTYNTSGQVIGTVSWSDRGVFASHYFADSDSLPGDTLYVHNDYDPEGRLLDVMRWARPKRASVDTVDDSFEYDAEGRTISERNTALAFHMYQYDEAGNVTLKSSNLTRIATTYDEMGKPTSQISRAMTYQTKDCHDFWVARSGSAPANPCAFYFPLSTSGSPLTIPGDTAYFTYDAFGNMTNADNKSAKIRRTYSPGGLLLTDTLRIRTLRYATEGSTVPGNDFTSHVYGIRYGYDATDRLDSLWHPDVLDPCSGPCPAQLYAYADTTGALDHVVDVKGRTSAFTYTLAGQLNTIGYPGAASLLSDYDPEGNTIHRWVTVGGSAVIADTMTLDPAGRVVEGHGRVVRDGYPLVVYNAYTGTGALAGDEIQPGSGVPKLEMFKYDALANQYWTKRYHVHLGGSADDPATRESKFDLNGHLTTITTPDSVTGTDAEWADYFYDGEGRTAWVNGSRWQPEGTTTVNEYQEAHYYDGAGRLVLYEGHAGSLNQGSEPNRTDGVREWYRYDALGRRVLVNTLHDPNCTMAGCESTVERFAWDGDQMLYEIRGPGGTDQTSATVESDAPTGNSPYGSPKAYGRIAYTHAGGIDQPLGLIRMDGNTTIAALFPHMNWRGQYETATDSTGQLYQDRTHIKWPGEVASAYLGATTLSDSNYYWMGGLLTNQGDASGLMYRRNRYYDPASGRFTQPDPAGIAGGLNSYGFGGGDPMNYSDPYGLWPDCTPWPQCSLQKAIVKGGVVGNLATVADMIDDALLVNKAAEVGVSLRDGKLSEAAAGAADIAMTLDGVEGLSPGQASNLARFEKNLPKGAEATRIFDLPAGGKAFQADVPGKVPGSKAVYEKQVDAAGTTLQMTKTTYDPQGNIVHVKDKMSGTTVTPQP